MNNDNKKIIVGMSGGVDSSVAAVLLKQQGYDVIGLFMHNWNEKDDDGICSSDEDYAYVREVCDKIDIPYYTVNFSKEYWDKVFTYFLDELKQGRTPNPDVMCNKEIKFKAFLNFAMGLNAKYLATGHYARIGQSGDRKTLLRGIDDNKDQTYFLYNLGQNELSKIMFPIGSLQKKMVREIAHKHDLATASRKDSMGICFIGERNFNKFISKYLPSQSGDIVDIITDNKIGRHDGLMHYTIGQRKGLGIGGTSTNSRPYFVAKKDIKNNILYAVQGDDDVLYSDGCIISNLSFVSGQIPAQQFQATVRLRHRQKDKPCDVIVENDTAQIKFHEKQRAVAPGQSAVLYQGDVCLGGGIIERATDCAHT